MTGWNMPPGCSVRDIPGCGPEDEAYESMCAEVEAAFDQIKKDDGDETVRSLSDAFLETIWKMLERAHSNGYDLALADAAEAEHLEAMARLGWVDEHYDAPRWPAESWLGG